MTFELRDLLYAGQFCQSCPFVGWPNDRGPSSSWLARGYLLQRSSSSQDDTRSPEKHQKIFQRIVFKESKKDISFHSFVQLIWRLLMSLLQDETGIKSPICYDQPKIQGYLIFLSNPVGPSLGLQVILGVPVTVEYDDGVGSCQIHAKTSSSSWQ